MNYQKKLIELGGTKPNVLIKDHRKRDNLQTFKKLASQYKNEIPEYFLDFARLVGAITFNQDVLIKGVEKIPIADDENKVSIDNFYDFSDDEASVMGVIIRFSGNLPENLLPICDGEPGDLIVIQMHGKNYGKIYYWYHEMDGNNSLYLVANSFSEFINNLKNKEKIEDSPSKDDVKVTKVSDKFLERLRKSGKIK